MTLKQITEDNYSKLLRSIDPSPDLLGRLRSVSFVRDKISSIREQLTDNRKNDALLNVLCGVPDDVQASVMNDFISALRSSGQDHVANIFRSESVKIPMTDKHYKLLSTNRRSLRQCMNPSGGLIDYLISVKMFSETDRERILSKATREDKAEETVNILLRKSDCAFDKFVSALNQTSQSHVSYLLTGDGNPPMSDEHREILQTKTKDLVKYTDTENGLLDRLITENVTTLEDAEQIRSVTDQNEMARKLLDILMRKSDGAFHKFIDSLNETGQEHVAYILTGEGSSRPLKEEHRRRLLSGPRDDLVNMIDAKNSDLITKLMSRGVFSAYDEQRVTNVEPDTTSNRNEMTLNLIARKSQSDFFKFISALHDTKQTHLAVKLIGANVVAKIKAVYESGKNADHVPNVDPELVEYMRKKFECDGDVVKELNESLNGVIASDVNEGCIEITFTCKSVESLCNFCDVYDSGELEKMLNEAFCSHFEVLQSLSVVISDEQFAQCAQTFARWIPITSEHREALLSSEKYLVDKIAISDDLLDKLSLCKRRRQAIERAATPEQRVKTMLDIISRQPDSAFAQFVDALKSTNQHEAADIVSGDTPCVTKSEASTLHASKTTHRRQVNVPLSNMFFLLLIFVVLVI